MNDGGGAVEELYANVVGGKLSLKGSKKKKKKKKKKRKRKKSAEENSDARAASSSSSSRKRSREEGDNNVAGGGESSTVPRPAIRTKSQQRFEERQKAKEKEVIEDMLKKTHRQRIDEYNEKLASLSEHHDIPKVGNAGLG